MPASKCSTYNLVGICKAYLTPKVCYSRTFAYGVKKYDVCKLQLDLILAEALRVRQEGGHPDNSPVRPGVVRSGALQAPHPPRYTRHAGR
jgi:hypothetical protein